MINKKRVHRIWREEGLQVAKRRRRKRVGESSGPIIDADAPNVVWAIDFQHDSTADGHKFKIASMVDEHTRESLLDLTDRSITGEDLVRALKLVIAVRGLPVLIRCDNGPELISNALREFCEELIGIRYIPPGEPWRNGFIASVNNRVRWCMSAYWRCVRRRTISQVRCAERISEMVPAQALASRATETREGVTNKLIIAGG